MTKPKLELVSLRKEYDGGDVVAVDDIDLDVAAGETVALLGPSGCGKSTTLNMIVGLEDPTAGDIHIDGKSIVDVPPGKRNVGLVFQDYAVFTHMTVKKNLAFGLEVRGAGKSEVKAVVAEAAELLGLGDKLNARASELGGSELQRVAIGRTLVTRPDILLLDEPLSNLETEARLNMRKELRRLQREIGLTIIYVTHDQVEALSLADRIAVMNMGHILQVEDSSLITSRPGHTFVAGFLGSPPMNLLKGHFEHAPDGVRFVRDDFSLPVAPAGAEVPQGQFTLGIRPESIRLAPTGSAGITGRVLLVEPRGPESVVTVAVGRELLKIVIPAAEAHPEEGDQTGLVVDPNALTFFESDHSRRIDLTFAPRTSQ